MGRWLAGRPSFTLVSLVTVLLVVTVSSLAVVGATIQGRSVEPSRSGRSPPPPSSSASS